MNTAHSEAAINEAYREGLGLQTSEFHRDYFAGNLLDYVQGHLAMGELDRAKQEMELWQKSLYPIGFAPSYMLDPTKKAPFKWVHELANHTEILPNNGRSVSQLSASPLWNIAALDIARYIESNYGYQTARAYIEELLPDLVRATYVYCAERYDPNSGLFFQIDKNEITLPSGILSQAFGDRIPKSQRIDGVVSALQRDPWDTNLDWRRKDWTAYKVDKRKQRRVADVAVTAMAYANIDALLELGSAYDLPVEQDRTMDQNYPDLPRDKKLVSLDSYVGLPPRIPSINDRTGHRTIESLLGLSWVPHKLGRATVLAAIRDLSSIVGHFKYGVPTFVTHNGRPTAIPKTDEGAVSSALSFRLGINLLEASHNPHLDYELKAELVRLGGRVIRITEEGIGTGIPRFVDPNTGLPIVRGGLWRQWFDRNQEKWLPTATTHTAAEEKDRSIP